MSIAAELDEILRDMTEIDSLAANTIGRLRVVKADLEALTQVVEALDRRSLELRKKVTRARETVEKLQTVDTPERVSLKVVGEP